ncbi:hypothetical protein GV793_17180 [Nocardia cyriacigeorgica]|nr:hypothetical protein [Nocardia cyriacigeorgica]
MPRTLIDVIVHSCRRPQTKADERPTPPRTRSEAELCPKYWAGTGYRR